MIKIFDVPPVKPVSSNGTKLFVKASSLYLVVIVSVIIAILTGSLISVAFFYRQEELKSQRYQHLSANLRSGSAILLSRDSISYDTDLLIDLFENETDSVSLRRETWGLFDIGIARSFEQTDTLQTVFLAGKSSRYDHTVIYLNDEDRPLSVSGSTLITGEAILPKSGVRAAHVDGKQYAGKKLVDGPIKVSARDLPKLNEEVLGRIKDLLEFQKGEQFSGHPILKQSFFGPALIFKFGKQVQDLSGISLEGKIILVSDTLIRISRSTSLKDIMIYAPAIEVEAGFRGSCQLFATDSVIAGKGVNFEYPSAIGVIKPADSQLQVKIQLGENTRFSGVLFTYEASRSERRTIVTLGKDSHIKGEIYAAGFLKMSSPLRIDGKVSCHRMVIQTPASLYENYLIDITMNRPARSKYYLSSMLFATAPQNEVLKWLN